MLVNRTKRLLRRALAGVGLVRDTEVAQAREAVARVRATERARVERERASAARKVAALEQKIEAAHERHVVEYAERSTLKKALLHYLARLKRLETIYGLHERRVIAQFEAAVRARRAAPPSAQPGDSYLASVCAAYTGAVARWETDSPPLVRRVSAGGLRWATPADLERDAATNAAAADSLLPIDELVMVRQFAVGGVMLDVGAGVGVTSIPRVVLGDFHSAYAAEPDETRYQCLVGNVLDAAVRGAVLPDRVEIAGAQDTRAPRFPGVPALSFTEWMDRLRIPAHQVRFVRLGARGAVMEILKEGLQALDRRDVVWQIDLPPPADGAWSPPLQELPDVIRGRFTHFKEIGVSPAEPWRNASEAARLIKHAPAEPPTGLLLFNLR